jgi:SAM-dependent methyltransferase
MLGLPIFVGGIESIQPSPHFDLIFLFQVLEHLEDPVKTIQQLSSFLKPNGKLIIGVPNFSSWQAKVGREKWFHLDVPRHLVHYSLSTLKILLKQCDMEIENVSYISWEHDPYGWVQSILNLLDRRYNRLTRLLMQIDSVDTVNLIHLVLGGAIGFVSVVLSLVSWLLHEGALIEVTAIRPKR